MARYGGNTSCVSVAVPGHDPLLLDLGTGLRDFGVGRPIDASFRGNCLLTHLHWDHVQGLPFFHPALRDGSEFDVYAPGSDQGSVAEVMARTFAPPLFPVTIAMLPGDIRFHDVADDDFTIAAPDPGPGAARADDLQVMSRLIPHVGPTCGYRVSWNGMSISYLSDHQQPSDGSFSVTPGALELCRGADVLIHDAQYTAAEFVHKSTWGHCTVDYAVWLAGHAGVRKLVLYHHDPAHDDGLIDVLTNAAAACGRRQGFEVIAAYEGLELTVTPHS